VIEVGRALSRSAPLTVLGLRISVSLAEYFAYAARRIHPDVRLVTRGGSVAYDALLQSREAGGDWLLAFSLPRHAQETLTALRVARGAGLRVALVTDLALGPLAEEADAVFATGTGSRLVFDSYAAPGMVAAALLQAMTDADPERTQARLEEYEQVAEEHQFFLRD
jgi:DNA-binding MurR/RpiR family transcriptional regulator